MMNTKSEDWMAWIIHVIGSDFFANCIAFITLIVAVIAIGIGGKKVSEIVLEYYKKKRNAIYSFHENLNIYMRRLERLISDNQGHPLGSLRLFSADEKTQGEGRGNEENAKELSSLAEKFLDYLSSKSDQIPAASTLEEENEWNAQIDELTDYLLDFKLYASNGKIPRLNNEAEIQEYLDKILATIDKISKQIEKEKNKFNNEFRNDNLHF